MLNDVHYLIFNLSLANLLIDKCYVNFNWMKLTGTIILLFLSCKLLAQQNISGIVMDKFTKLPIRSANLKINFIAVTTDADGRFELANFYLADTLRITCSGYKLYKLKLNSKALISTILIELEPTYIILKEVNVKSLRDFKQDSLRNRKLFSSIFNYKAPALKDVFIEKSLSTHLIIMM